MHHAFDSFPVLHTERLDLIEVSSLHTPDLFQLVTDNRVSRFFNVMPATQVSDMEKAVERFRKMYADKTGIRWAIQLKGATNIVGTIGFYNLTDKHRGVLAYALIPEYWNKGYVSEALEQILRFGFQDLELMRIDAEIRPGNIPSEQVLLKYGFTHEGLLRQWVLWNGEYQDMNMYALLAEEWISYKFPPM